MPREPAVPFAGRHGDNPMWDHVILLVEVFAGLAGAALAPRLPARGKAGLALGLVPLAGFPLMAAFC
jgi:hypothetical protein